MRGSVWFAVAMLGAAAPAAAQNVKAGVDAWGRGDYAAAVDQWRGPAVAGDADAQFNLGQAYKLGRGVPLDPVLAESWFRKAALQGHAQAEDNYGLALFQANKKADALPWLNKSVARGEPRAQLVLGTMLFNGDGVSRDYPRAYALMTLASRAGLSAASETLAQMDQYITPADRERGTQLAQQYAAAQRSAPDANPAQATRIATADLPPTRPPAPAPSSAAPRPRLPQASPDRPVPDRVAEQPVIAHPAPGKPAPAATQAKQVAKAGGDKTPGPVARAAKPPLAPKPRPTGEWRIQIGAFSTQANAEAQWAKVHGRLAGAQPAYVKAGNVIRLQAVGYGDKARAQRACTTSGVSCVVIAP
ncbi:SPOR domain-containing protein [Sphingomonas sp.]|uniref:SPOR domain-containing protein n=1 Tax=Sphingomonas sp. TaxID=28214 RepID=UPI00258C3156|nr:SPOR domain-containing protein [Sphingomonas sp.]